MRKRVWILGIIFGLIIPYTGIFLGLQVSTTLGNILAFPVIALVYITGTPFGMWGWGLFLAAALLSIFIWTVILAVLDKFIKSS